MFSLISQGISLGFVAGAMPSPFKSYVITMTLLNGWRKSIIVILTPLITDGPIILLSVLVLQQLTAELVRLIQLVGGFYLLWIAYKTWKQFYSGDYLSAPASSQRRTLAQGVMMNWLNPNPYIFWGTITGPLLVSGLQQSLWHGLAFLLAFYMPFMCVLVIYVFIFDRLRRLDKRITNIIFMLTLVVLVAFGLSLILQALGT